MRSVFTVLFVNFCIVFLSLSPAFAKSKDPLDRLIIGAFTGGMLIALYYGLKAIWRLFKKKRRSKEIVEHLKVEEMDKYLQMLGLKQGASRS